ncbi:MAG: hypothetical protein R1F54_02725 [Candidatus Zeuxoniibacter abyssi]|nr:MAG: hypothetical protein R1F54_02725 [Candidatus Persebacteraceae bacterium AB1(2)]
MSSSLTQAGVLCGEIPDKYNLHEEETYNLDNALNSLDYLKSDLPNLIEEEHKYLAGKIISGEEIGTRDLNYPPIFSREQYYISHPNTIAIIHGTLLKQRALLLKYKYAETKNKENKAAYEKALNAFCDYVKTTYYSD